MKRREFITLLGGAAVWPVAAGAQQPGDVSVVGFLSSASPEPFEQFAAALRRGLNQSGYIEGRNLAIEFRWAENHYERLPAMAADLVRRQVAVIAATTTPAALAANAEGPQAGSEGRFQLIDDSVISRGQSFSRQAMRATRLHRPAIGPGVRSGASWRARPAG